MHTTLKKNLLLAFISAAIAAVICFVLSLLRTSTNPTLSTTSITSSDPNTSQSGTTASADKNVSANIYLRKLFNSVDSTVYEHQDTDEEIVSFKTNDNNSTKNCDLGNIDLSSFVSLNDNYTIVLFIKNTGSNHLVVSLSNLVLQNLESAIKINLVDNNTSKTISENEYYVFSLKWSISSFETSVSNSISSFSIVLSSNTK